MQLVDSMVTTNLLMLFVALVLGLAGLLVMLVKTINPDSGSRSREALLAFGTGLFAVSGRIKQTKQNKKNHRNAHCTHNISSLLCFSLQLA